jgi:hypothetical protein
MREAFEAVLQDVDIDITGTGEHEWVCTQFKALWAIEFELRSWGIKSVMFTARFATALISPIDDDGNEIKRLDIRTGQNGWSVEIESDYWQPNSNVFVTKITNVEIDIEAKKIHLQIHSK